MVLRILVEVYMGTKEAKQTHEIFQRPRIGVSGVRSESLTW